MDSVHTVSLFRIYLSFAHIQMQKMFVLRGMLVFTAMRWFVRMYILQAVWRVIIRPDDALGSIFTINVLLTYVIIGTVHSNLVTPLVAGLISHRVRNGDIVYNLIRPTHPLITISVESVGRDIGKAIPALLLLILIVPFTEFALPNSIVHGVSYLISALMGLTINFLIYLCLGLSAFWFIRIDGITGLYWLIQGLLTGALFPLLLLPSNLQDLARLTPFAMVVDIPVSIYLGLPLPVHLGLVLLIELIWLLITLLAVVFVWRAVKGQIQIQGG